MIASQGISQVRLRIGNDTLNCYTDIENRKLANILIERDMYYDATMQLGTQLSYCDSIAYITDNNALNVQNLKSDMDALVGLHNKIIKDCSIQIEDRDVTITRNNKVIRRLSIISTVLLVLLIIK